MRFTNMARGLAKIGVRRSAFGFREDKIRQPELRTPNAERRKFSFAVLLALSIFIPARSSAAQDLRVFESTHYRIHTDLDSDLSDDLARRLDAMYEEYSRRLADLGRPDDSTPLEVYLVHSQEKYLHLVGLTMGGTAGSFNASRHLLAAFLDGQGRDALRRTLQHEAFHQFAASVIGRNFPVWLNEGLAQVFEEGIWTGDSFILGQVPPRRLRQLHHDIEDGALVDFSKVLQMNGPQWAKGFHDPSISATQYNQTWAMTHFLIYATDDSGSPKYRSRLIDMLRRLRNGEDSDDAFHDAFSANIRGFHDRFLDYFSTLTPTPLATMIENQGILADMLVEAEHRHLSFSSIEQFRALCVKQQWQIHYRRANLQWLSDPDPNIYFNSLDGRPLAAGELYFERDPDRPLPDLVLHCENMPKLRTHFINGSDKIEHETIVEGTH
jgi:uncharacterized protein DUF1570